MGAIYPYFDHRTFLMSTFQAYYGLDLKNTFVSGYDWTPKIFFNPHGSL